MMQNSYTNEFSTQFDGIINAYIAASHEFDGSLSRESSAKLQKFLEATELFKRHLEMFQSLMVNTPIEIIRANQNVRTISWTVRFWISWLVLSKSMCQQYFRLPSSTWRNLNRLLKSLKSISQDIDLHIFPEVRPEKILDITDVAGRKLAHPFRAYVENEAGNVYAMCIEFNNVLGCGCNATEALNSLKNELHLLWISLQSGEAFSRDMFSMKRLFCLAFGEDMPPGDKIIDSTELAFDEPSPWECMNLYVLSQPKDDNAKECEAWQDL